MVKVNRTPTPPASLEKMKKNSSWEYDLIQLLAKDFNDKCYICELKGLQDPNVEHLLPKHTRKDLEFDWTNLFFACPLCNKVKEQKKYDIGILDCTKEDPEERILFDFNGQDIEVSAIHDDDEKAKLTAELVTEVFNLKNTAMRIYESQKRMNELKKEMSLLLSSLEEYKKSKSDAFLKKKLASLLARESAFAAFKRCYVRKRLDRFPELEPLVND